MSFLNSEKEKYNQINDLGSKLTRDKKIEQLEHKITDLSSKLKQREEDLTIIYQENTRYLQLLYNF